MEDNNNIAADGIVDSKESMIFQGKASEDKKKIVIHIVPNGDLTSGGLVYASIRLAHEQARIGLNVYILEINPIKSILPDWSTEAVRYIEKPMSGGFFKRLNVVRSLVKKNSVVMHFHGVWYPRYLPYFLLAFITKSAYIISPHGNLEFGALRQKFFKKYIARKVYFNRILSGASALWACSEKERQSLRRQYPGAHIDIIPIGVDIPNLLGVDRSNSICGEERKTILLVGRLNHGKGLLNLVHAWSNIQDDGWKIIIAGPDENNYREKLIQKIADLNLTRFFILPGYIDSRERDALYRVADLFVLPSLSENFGIVVPEALSYGVPVLTTNETPWTYVGLERGCLCVGTKSDDLLEGLRVMMHITAQERHEMGKKARSFVKMNFEWRQVAMIAKSAIDDLQKLK